MRDGYTTHVFLNGVELKSGFHKEQLSNLFELIMKDGDELLPLSDNEVKLTVGSWKIYLADLSFEWRNHA